MKKLQICLLVLFSALFAGCDTEGEITETGYTTYSVEVVHPDIFSDFNNLKVSFDGDNLFDAIYPGREQKTGQLLIEYQDYTPLDTTITLQPGETLQLLLLPGKMIELYYEEDYISFTGSFIMDGYVAKLNGQELATGLNYINKRKVAGNLEIYKIGGERPVATIPVNIENGANLNIMKLGDSFVEVPVDDEPNPTSNKILKARFLYQGDEMLTQDVIRMDFYINDDWCWVFFPECVGSVTLEKGKFSEYIELDYSFREPDAYDSCMDGAYGYSFYYDVIDPATEERLIDHNNYASYLVTNDELTTDYMTWSYKKATFILKNGGNSCDFESGLSTPWE